MGRLPLLLAMLSAAFCATMAATGPKVSTQSGDVSGAKLKSFVGNSYFSFKGIPFAEPPLGPMRFRAPQPHQGWTGVRDAKKHGSKCLQYSMLSAGALEGDENCLFVNVYTPSLPAEGEHPELPVMVWIHGGGFVTGSGDADFYGPDYFMDEQVVLVTFNYRLGPFGFLTTADANAPGNYGLHDQVLALEWVQANIEAFGGNRDDVTIFGESAGGASVGLQVLSPRSRGLFAKAISQSGASFCNFGASGEPQGKAADQLATLLKCSTASSRELVGCMRQRPAKEILRSLGEMIKDDPVVQLPIHFKPRVDRESQMPFLPRDPYISLRDGQFNLVPWMTGLNRDEAAFFVGQKRLKPESLAACSGRDWGRWASSILQLTGVTTTPAVVAEKIYRQYFGDAGCGEENLQPLSDMLSDRWFTACITSEANLAAAHTPVYMYVLDHMGPGRQNFLRLMALLMGKLESYRDLGVPHAEDLLYLFKPVFGPPIARDSDEHKMIRFMVSLWTNFARRGYPSTDAVPMPSWPIYTASRQEHMRLNMAPSVGRAAFSERVEFWNQLDIQESWHLALFDDNKRDEL
ncbi:cocaine esterase-like [Pollicipes pollicipes]|uniref:cocaine esterase-like n=1 Tax=Pollicipes pollicipes TaxID=41117 RepID=UPI0018858F40|nr:cocaine esterase-like [Pollicipes pollicipes]